MAMLRKYYQENVGSDLTATLWFSTLSSFAAFLIGLIFSGGFGFDYVIMLCALAYAFMCTTTSMLCLIGAKYGSVSGTILCASMGTLILPSLFSGVFDSESTLSALQIVGFLFAILAMLTGFAGQHRSGKEAGKEGKKLRWIQVAVFLTNGMALVIFKALSLFRPGFHQGAFVTEYMLLAAIASFLLLILVSKHNKKGEKNTAQDKFLSRQAILAALAYAAVFFTADYLALNCTSRIPLAIQAPLSFCLPIICTAVLEWLVYKQKFGYKDYLQMVFALACSVCFAL